MLADAGDDVAVALRRLVYLLDDVLRQHFLRLADDDRRVLAAHLIEPGEPALARLVGDMLVQLAQRRLRVAPQRCVRLHVLADLRGIDLQVDDLGFRREVLQAAGDAVVEAHTDADEEVRLADRDVVPVHPVHPGHPQVQRMCAGEAADAEQGRDHRDVGLLGQLPDLRERVRDDHAVAGEDDRPLGLLD